MRSCGGFCVVKLACQIRVCFWEVEASTAPSPPALFPGGGGFFSSAIVDFSVWGVKAFLACVAGSWFPSSVLGFRFYLCFCGFVLVSLEELSLEDDRSSPVLMSRRSFLLSSGDEWRRMRSRYAD